MKTYPILRKKIGADTSLLTCPTFLEFFVFAYHILIVQVLLEKGFLCTWSAFREGTLTLRATFSNLCLTIS